MNSAEHHDSQSQLSAQQREQIKLVLDSIETAQLLIDEARRHISSIPGFGEQWSRLENVRQSINSMWHEIDHRRCELRTIDD